MGEINMAERTPNERIYRPDMWDHQLALKGPSEVLETSIQSAYFGKNRNIDGRIGNRLGLHLAINSGPGNGIIAQWEATYTQLEDIDGLLDDLFIGYRSWENHGVPNVQNLAGAQVVAHYIRVKDNPRDFTMFLTGLSAPKRK